MDTAVAAYLQALPKTQQQEFERIRAIVLKIEPAAVLVMSYGVPTFKYNKKALLHFGGFKDHMSLFPASDDLITFVGNELADYRTSKGTLQYTENRPIPTEMVQKIVRFRRAGIN